MNQLGKIISVPLRDVWGDEARDFTPWLASEVGLNLLGEKLGLELEHVSTEEGVGPYKADIVAKDSQDEGEANIVVIENQLEQTNHDHLGKILTYAAGLGANSAVWIAKNFTDEHRQAIDWLNENTPDLDFFALEINLVAIGDSNPAPQFNIVSRPNEWTKAVRAGQAKELSKLNLDQLRFWEEFVNFADNQDYSEIKTGRKARPRHWYNISVGKAGITISLTVNSVSEKIACALYMGNENAKSFFDKLIKNKDQIEEELGYALDWQRLDDKKASRIAIYQDGSFYDEESSDQSVRWLYERSVDFHKVFRAAHSKHLGKARV